MAYKKNYARKRTYKKKGYLARASKYTQSAITTANTAHAAYSLATKLARFVNTENKFWNSNAATTNVTDAGATYSLFLPPQGDTDSSRSGDSVKLLRISGRMFFNSVAAANGSVVRVIIFRGKQENQVFPGIGDVIDMTIGTNDFLAPKPYDDRFRTKILYDKFINLPVQGPTSTVRDINIKLYGHVQFGAATTNIEDGGLYLGLISNINAANYPTITWNLRTTYVDN